MSHPLHPALVHFPIACWTLVTVGDLLGIYFINNSLLIISVAVLLCIALISALAAMLAGLLEVDKLTYVPQSKSTALWHIALITLSFCFYTASLVLRVENQEFVSPDVWVIGCSLCGFLTLLVGGWFGGQLVYGHGVGQIRN